MTKALLVAAALACAGGTAGAAKATGGLAPITTNEAAVAVKVTPRTVTGAVWEFEVAFDTHSQELRDDLLKAASLLAADGSPMPPIEWKGAPAGGHHRSGVLRFAAPNPPPASIALSISRVGEARPRIYRWNLR